MCVCACMHVGGKTKAFCPCEDMNSAGYLKASSLFSSRHKRALITDVSITVNLVFFLQWGQLKWKSSGTPANKG